MWGLRTIAKLVQITPMSLWDIVDIILISIHGVYNQLTTRGPPIVDKFSIEHGAFALPAFNIGEICQNYPRVQQLYAKLKRLWCPMLSQVGLELQ